MYNIKLRDLHPSDRISREHLVQNTEDNSDEVEPQTTLSRIRPGLYMRRFWLRGLCCTSFPAVLTLYYVLIWKLWLPPQSKESLQQALPHGRGGAPWVFYSWFVLSTIGINLLKYGLSGAEASMLMDPRWAATNAMQIMMHADKNWSGPSGWMHVIRTGFSGGFKTRPSRTWFILAVTSLIAFVSLPISGLTMEMGDGFAPGNSPAVLVGSQYGNDTGYPDILSAAQTRFQTAREAILPRRSAIYTGPTQPVDGQEWKANFPNVWPDAPSSDVFVTAQSSSPVTGEAWGVRLNYNCTTIERLEDFKYLSGRVSADNHTLVVDSSAGGFRHYYKNATDWPWEAIEGILELAISVRKDQWEDDHAYNWLCPNPNDLHPVTYEVALWQARRRPFNESDRQFPPFTASEAIPDPTIPSMASFYDTWPHEPSLAKLGFTRLPNRAPFVAIGAQCNASFESGVAYINGLRGSYTNFRPDTTWRSLSPYRGRCAMANAVQDMLIYTTENTSEIQNQNQWLGNLFSSVSATDVGFGLDMWERAQQSYLGATQLRTALMRTFKNYAIETVHPNQLEWTSSLNIATDASTNPDATDFLSSSDGRSEESSNSNSSSEVNPKLLVTACIPTKILTPGPIPPEVLLTLLIIVSLISILLGSTFALRPRWSETLNGFSLFRFGAHISAQARKSGEDGWWSVRDYEDCDLLLDIPGGVGDVRVGWDEGRVGLVDLKAGSGERESEDAMPQNRKMTSGGGEGVAVRCKVYR